MGKGFSVGGVEPRVTMGGVVGEEAEGDFRRAPGGRGCGGKSTYTWR